MIAATGPDLWIPELIGSAPALAAVLILVWWFLKRAQDQDERWATTVKEQDDKWRAWAASENAKLIATVTEATKVMGAVQAMLHEVTEQLSAIRHARDNTT